MKYFCIRGAPDKNSGFFAKFVQSLFYVFRSNQQLKLGAKVSFSLLNAYHLE